jgi:hypothetical protein
MKQRGKNNGKYSKQLGNGERKMWLPLGWEERNRGESTAGRGTSCMTDMGSACVQ